MNRSELSPDLIWDAEKKNIDLDATLSIINKYNAGKYDSVQPIEVTELPAIDGETILAPRGDSTWVMEAGEAQKNLDSAGWKGDIGTIASIEKGRITFDVPTLRTLGISLLPTVSYGILNGGSATSFFDSRKNHSFDPHLFELYQEEFHSAAADYGTWPKGLTPGFYNSDGSPGPSFIELKMRNILLHQLKWGGSSGSMRVLAPLFQMTSINNNERIVTAFHSYRENRVVGDLIEATGCTVTDVLTGIQPLLGALTHTKEGKEKNLFDRADGSRNATLPLPGGHGQNFSVLKDIYKKLYSSGKRLIYLGNVDNLGYTADPVCVAMMVVSGKQAGFDFSLKTPVDVKGGILVRDQRGMLNCADIGPAISQEEVERHSSKGNTILFNCATGIFNLAYLTENIDRIIEMLPMRISDQEKDAGAYAQAEQITWEIIGMLDNFFIFAVEKYERFLAAKVALETFMTSGIKLDHSDFPEEKKELAAGMHRGLRNHLETEYGMEEIGGRWQPIHQTGYCRKG